MAFTFPQIVAIALALAAITAVGLRRVADMGGRRYARYASVAALKANDGLIVQDVRGRVRWANDAYCEMMGLTRDEVLGRNPLSFCMPDDQRPSDAEIANFRYESGNALFGRMGTTERVVHRNRHSSGRLFWNQIAMSYHHNMRDGFSVVLVCRDVTADIDLRDTLERKTAEMEHLANHDGLTGAANRAHLIERVREMRTETEGVDAELAILHIDLDKFKQLNDRFGHAAGDAALVHVTQATQSVLRTDDLLARIGGDEFAIACRGIRDRDGLLAIADKIREAIRSPFDFQGTELVCHASVGGTFCQGRSDTLDKMLGRADMALYEVKRSGRAASALYDPKQAATTAQHNRFTDALRLSISGGCLDFRFQPVIASGDDSIHSFETSAYWRQPDGSYLAPSKLLAQAKLLGLRYLIDEQAARAACKLQAELSKRGFEAIPVSFNVASDGFIDPEAAQTLAAIPAELNVPSAQIWIEVQAARLSKSDSIASRPDGLAVLSEAGFGIVARNFCGGFIGLETSCGGTLAAIKIDTAKIGLNRKGKLATTILHAALEVGDAMGYPMIVTGLDDDEADAMAAPLSPPLVQGDMHAVAMPANEVLPWLLDRATAIAPQPQHSY